MEREEEESTEGSTELEREEEEPTEGSTEVEKEEELTGGIDGGGEGGGGVDGGVDVLLVAVVRKLLLRLPLSDQSVNKITD